MSCAQSPIHPSPKRKDQTPSVPTPITADDAGNYGPVHGTVPVHLHCGYPPRSSSPTLRVRQCACVDASSLISPTIRLAASSP
eukprot:535846-Prymnesium_polylepis.1